MHPFLGPSLLSNFTRTSRVNTSVIRQLTILLDTLVWHTPSSFPLLSKYPTSARPTQEVLTRLGSRTNPDKTRSIVHRSLNIKMFCMKNQLGRPTTPFLPGSQTHSDADTVYPRLDTSATQCLILSTSLRLCQLFYSSNPCMHGVFLTGLGRLE